MDIFLKNNNIEGKSIEDKVDYIKKNKSRLILPVDGISDEHLDKILYDIKNNWKKSGHQYHEIVENWYNILTN